MNAGSFWTVETIRAATVLYVWSVAAWLERRDAMARAAWAAGCVLYLAHAAAAFQFYHHWSHSAAYLATERQAGWGGGLYFNYFFTALWVADAAWWWRGLAEYRERRPWIPAAVHGFMGFMFFNATVVFGSGFVRWFGVGATVLLGLLWVNRRRFSRS
jgi:hypothetical protein